MYWVRISQNATRGTVKLVASKKRKRKPAKRTKRSTLPRRVPSSTKMQALVESFARRIGTPDRPEIIGILTVIAWRMPEQVHAQSAMFATDDSIGEIMLATLRGHEIDDHRAIPVGHA